MSRIGDVFFRTLLETKELMVDAAKAGDQAGMTMGQRMSKGIGTAMKVGLGVVAAGAAIATKGLLELDNVTAQFTADTGASAEEAERARKAILRMSGDNLQPMTEIGAVLGKVHTDLDLTGEAAENTAQDFLTFSRVTKRDASEEVAAFDDILDAWGVTADKSRGIMDKLVVSHQEYGGVIADDEAALAAMAPQLKAFNLGIDDGIGLLNLFKSSGLDAASIPRALNSAIQKLDGRPLEDFVAELAGIEDPGERARRAIEVFGARAGVGLANAIKPGMTSLHDFKITTEEATGATDRAREAIDGTFSNRVQLAIKAVTAKITAFGASFGPALTGLASLAALGGSLGFDKLIVKGFEKLGGSAAVKAAAAAAGSAIGGVYGAAVAAAEKLVKLAKDAFGIIAKRSIVKTAAERAGFIVGGVFGTAAVAGERLASLLAAVFTKLPFIASLRGAVLASAIKIGTLQGTAIGAAAGRALPLALVSGLAFFAEDIEQELRKVSKNLNIWKMLGIDFEVHPEEWPWPLGPNGAPDWAGGITAVATAMSDLSNFPGKLADDLAGSAPVVAAGAQEGIADPIIDVAEDIPAAAAKAVRPTPRAIADSLRAGQFRVKDAVEAIKDAVKNTLSKTKEIAQLEGFLAGKALAKAMNDKRPEVRAEAEAWKTAAEERLFALRNDVPNIAQRTGQEYADALERKRAEVAAAAAQLTAAARGKIIALRADAYGYGRTIGQRLADGLYSKLGAFAYATSLYAGKMESLLRLHSPAKEGPLSEAGGPEGWARKGAELYTRGWSSVVPRLDQLFAGLPVPGLTAPSIALAGAGALGAGAIGAVPLATSGGGLTVNGGIHVTVQGGTTNAQTGEVVADAVAGALRDQASRGVFGLKP